MAGLHLVQNYDGDENPVSKLNYYNASQHLLQYQISRWEDAFSHIMGNASSHHQNPSSKTVIVQAHNITQKDVQHQQNSSIHVPILSNPFSMPSTNMSSK